MEARSQAAAQALKQVAPSWALEAIHLETSNFLEADGRCAGLEIGGRAHDPNVGFRVVQIIRRVHSFFVMSLTPVPALLRVDCRKPLPPRCAARSGSLWANLGPLRAESLCHSICQRLNRSLRENVGSLVRRVWRAISLIWSRSASNECFRHPAGTGRSGPSAR